VIWLVLLAGAIAVPVIIERRRAPMDDIQRGAAPGQFAVLSQGVTHYEWTGPVEGPVLICIHGLTTPSFVWRGLSKGLAKIGFRILTYDLYGRGFSDRPKGVQDRTFFLRQLEDLLDHLAVEDDLTLIGYSMGGSVAACFAAAAPERIRQIFLIAPAGMKIALGWLGDVASRTPLIGDWLMLTLFPAGFRQGIRAEGERFPQASAVHEAQAAQLDFRGFVPAVIASRRGILSRSLRDEHETIRDAGIPVLALWGAQDSVIPAAAIGTLAEWNRDAVHEVITGAGHGLTYTHSDALLTRIGGALGEDA
jgi:pimeloyl-ACP methyl ester carboxylesterase